jgi:prepilin-type N-terminal cleavage/methylation domain-containing protein
MDTNNYKVLKNQLAFTLIELMIVIAIIGILAAIAIPFFAQYRTRSFNSSAVSDIRNLANAESALFSDLTMYGATEMAANKAGCTGGANRTGDIATGGLGALVPFITTQDAFGNQYALGIGVSKGTSIYSTTASMIFFSDMYASQAKHIQGDIVYGMENDSTSVYQNNTLYTSGDTLTTANEVVPTNGADFILAAGAGWTTK